MSYGNYLLSVLNFTKTNNNNLDYLLIQKSLLKISVYYDTIEYDLLTESPQINFINFIVNIGYAFGLIFGKFKIFHLIILVFFKNF